MMQRVYGKVDGKSIEFDYADGDRWNVAVPYDSDGEYIVEIIAEDDAGNQTYLAKMLFIVDAKSLCAHMINILPYWTSIVVSFYEIEIFSSKFFTELKEDYCSFNERGRSYA